jgi:hypothetical protein
MIASDESEGVQEEEIWTAGGTEEKHVNFQDSRLMAGFEHAITWTRDRRFAVMRTFDICLVYPNECVWG